MVSMIDWGWAGRPGRPPDGLASFETRHKCICASVRLKYEKITDKNRSGSSTLSAWLSCRSHELYPAPPRGECRRRAPSRLWLYSSRWMFHETCVSISFFHFESSEVFQIVIQGLVQYQLVQVANSRFTDVVPMYSNRDSSQCRTRNYSYGSQSTLFVSVRIRWERKIYGWLRNVV